MKENLRSEKVGYTYQEILERNVHNNNSLKNVSHSKMLLIRVCLPPLKDAYIFVYCPKFSERCLKYACPSVCDSFFLSQQVVVSLKLCQIFQDINSFLAIVLFNLFIRIFSLKSDNQDH